MLNRNIFSDISEKIQRANRDYSLFDGCNKILAALSGGADSCCLLLVLEALSERYGFSLCALHVNHGIRGKEADRDEEFARQLCKNRGIDFVCKRIDVPSLAKEKSLSLELCARNERYRIFEQYSRENGFDCVAVAHNACDNSETVLFNLARGTSIKGLCGIPPKRKLCDGVNIIRPLIYVTREEIEEYLEAAGQNFVTDSTNLSDDHTRNYLRHEVLVSLRKINPSLDAAIARSSYLIKKDSDFLERIAKQSETRELEKLSALDECILSRVVINLFSCVSSEMPENKHVDALCKKIYEYRENPSLRCSISFPDKKRAYIENGVLTFCEDVRTRSEKKDYELALGEGINVIEDVGFVVCVSYKKEENIPQTITDNKENIYKIYTTDYLYSDKIPLDLCARNRREGDRIYCRGMNKSIKRLMTQMKIPADDRPFLPIICEGEKTVLVPKTAKNDMFCTDKGVNCISISVYKRCN